MLTRTYKIDNTNRVVLYMQGEYAFKSLYFSNPQQTPAPTTGSDHNSTIRFQSSSPGSVTVDWDDGNVETFQMQNNGSSYIIGWRCLDVDYYKNPSSTGGGWGWGIDQSTGQYIKPLPNHHYTDGETRERHIIITFTCEDVYYFNSETVTMWSFPILELPALQTLGISYTSYINEIPFVRISKVKNLTTLKFTSLGSKLQFIPDSLFEMTGLTSLAISGVFNLSDPDASNFRNIKKLKNLKSLTATVCNITTYIKEFNDLPNLENLNISNANLAYYGADGVPTFDEISTINPSIKIMNVLGAGYSGSGIRTSWMENVFAGKGLENLTQLLIEYQNNLTLILPEYLKEMNSLNYIYGLNSFKSQSRADTWVNNLYSYITNWEQVTMTNKLKNGKRNQFYGLSVSMWSSSYPYDYRPSGTYQAPSGFVKGVSNGNPTTPMEKIYVMQNNYAHSWNIRPA